MFDDPEVFIIAKPNNGHEIAARLVMDSVAKKKHYPYFIYRYADMQAQWINLTLHPRDMGLEGFEELHIRLGSMVDEGWRRFVNNAKVTQIEVAIDLEGISLNNVHLLPDQAKTMTVYESGTKTQTVYLGKSKSNQTKVCDRAAKRNEQGSGTKYGQCTRIERKKSNLNLKQHQLGEIANPFTNVKFVKVPATPPPSETKNYQWTLFTDSVAQRGLEPALKLLPQAKRTAYRKYLNKKVHFWWKPEVIWSKWPKVLNDLKLTDAKFWQ